MLISFPMSEGTGPENELPSKPLEAKSLDVRAKPSQLVNHIEMIMIEVDKDRVGAYRAWRVVMFPK